MKDIDKFLETFENLLKDKYIVTNLDKFNSDSKFRLGICIGINAMLLSMKEQLDLMYDGFYSDEDFTNAMIKLQSVIPYKNLFTYGNKEIKSDFICDALESLECKHFDNLKATKKYIKEETEKLENGKDKGN